MKNRFSRKSRSLKDRSKKEQIRLNARLNRQSKDEGGSVAFRFIALASVFLIAVVMMFVHKYFTEGIQTSGQGMEAEEVYELETPYFALTDEELKEYQDYVIKKGDTLWSLSNELRIPVRKIKAINKMSDDNITVGQKIKIPLKKP